jgi:hypothetical protein
MKFLIVVVLVIILACVAKIAFVPGAAQRAADSRVEGQEHAAITEAHAEQEWGTKAAATCRTHLGIDGAHTNSPTWDRFQKSHGWDNASFLLDGEDLADCLKIKVSHTR